MMGKQKSLQRVVIQPCGFVGRGTMTIPAVSALWYFTMLTTEALGKTLHHHYAVNLRNKEANCWDMEHLRENPLDTAQPAQQTQLLLRGACLTIMSLEFYFLFKLTLHHVSLEMVSHFTGAFRGLLPWDSWSKCCLEILVLCLIVSNRDPLERTTWLKQLLPFPQLLKRVKRSTVPLAKPQRTNWLHCWMFWSFMPHRVFPPPFDFFSRVCRFRGKQVE